MITPKKILLVAHSSLILEREKSYFFDLPYRILTAVGGREGLRVMEHEQPDLVLLDEEMPDLEGHVVLAKMRQQERLRDVTVILVTENADDEVIDCCMRCGLSDYIRRPFEAEDLLRKVAKALGLPERKAVSFMVRVRRGNESTFGKAIDLSGGGIRIETRESLGADEEVSIEFFLPGTKTRVQIKALVVRRLPPAPLGRDRRYGLKFIGLSKELSRQIESSMKSR